MTIVSRIHVSAEAVANAIVIVGAVIDDESEASLLEDEQGEMSIEDSLQQDEWPVVKAQVGHQSAPFGLECVDEGHGVGRGGAWEETMARSILVKGEAGVFPVVRLLEFGRGPDARE